MTKQVGWRRKFLGLISHISSPGYAGCIRCGWSWKFMENIPEIKVNFHVGLFCLCRRCWNELTELERIEFFELAADKNGWGLSERCCIALWKASEELLKESKKLVPYEIPK